MDEQIESCLNTMFRSSMTGIALRVAHILGGSTKIEQIRLHYLLYWNPFVVKLDHKNGMLGKIL